MLVTRWPTMAAHALHSDSSAVLSGASISIDTGHLYLRLCQWQGLLLLLLYISRLQPKYFVSHGLYVPSLDYLQPHPLLHSAVSLRFGHELCN